MAYSSSVTQVVSFKAKSHFNYGLRSLITSSRTISLETKYKSNVNNTGMWHRSRRLKTLQKYLREVVPSSADYDWIVDIVVNLYAIQLSAQNKILQGTTASSVRSNVCESYRVNIHAPNCVLSAKVGINLVTPKLKYLWSLAYMSRMLNAVRN